ncbi:MAG: SDR family oxidoreductase [Candidatus Woesearchaeota archaeon]
MGRKLVFMDDRNDVRDTYQALLIRSDLVRAHGIEEVVTASSPREMVYITEFLINEGYEVPLVISDEVTPGEEPPYECGLSGLKIIRNRFPYIRTLLLTAEAGLDVAQEGFNQGIIDGFIKKRAGTDDQQHDLEADLGGIISKLLGQYFSDYRVYKPNPKSMKGSHILLTGVTGFLGYQLALRLLADTDATLYLYGRSKRGKSFTERTGLMNDDTRDRLVFVEGDLSDTSALKELEGIIDEVWHLAAVTSFREKDRKKIMDSNLLGTINLLQSISKFRKLLCCNYVSSVYGAGNVIYPGTVMEGPFESADHKNAYEQSKYFTEAILRSFGLPFRVLRPSILVGDSSTGYSDMKTVYGVARLFDAISRTLRGEGGENLGVPISYNGDQLVTDFPLLGETTARKNVIPIDYAIGNMMGIREADAELYGTYHITMPEPTTIGGLSESIQRSLNMTGIKFFPTLPDSLPKVVREANALISEYSLYMTRSDPYYDRTNTDRVCGPPPHQKLPNTALDFLFSSFFDAYKERLEKEGEFFRMMVKE